MWGRALESEVSIILAAVGTPQGSGSFPVLVWFHGGDFAQIDTIQGGRTKEACSAESLPLNTKAMVSLIRELPAFRPRSFHHPYPI